MKSLMTVGAERNQIMTGILAKMAAEANVVNLKILRGSTMLTPPGVTLQYFHTDSAITYRTKPQSICPDDFIVVFRSAGEIPSFADRAAWSRAGRVPKAMNVAPRFPAVLRPRNPHKSFPDNSHASCLSRA